jgi:hypothetical protein
MKERNIFIRNFCISICRSRSINYVKISDFLPKPLPRDNNFFTQIDTKMKRVATLITKFCTKMHKNQFLILYWVYLHIIYCIVCHFKAPIWFIKEFQISLCRVWFGLKQDQLWLGVQYLFWWCVNKNL